jgi:hypothetical protein
MDLYLVAITSVTENLKLEISLYKLPYIPYQLLWRTVKPRGRGSLSGSVTCFLSALKRPDLFLDPLSVILGELRGVGGPCLGIK